MNQVFLLALERFGEDERPSGVGGDRDTGPEG